MAEGTNEVSVTPAAEQLAKEAKIDLSEIKGTGANGNILKSDVEQEIARRQQDEAADVEAGAKPKKSAKAKKREAAKKKREEEKAKRKAEREAKRKEKEEAKAKAEEEQRKKDEAAFNQFNKTEADARRVKLSEVAPWDTAGAQSRTSESIAHLGAVTAVTLRELTKKTKGGHKYEVVDGARRLEDYKEQGIEEFPATILPPDTDEKTFAATRFLANLARSENVIHEAESMQVVMDEAGWSQSDLSKYTGIPLPTVSKTLKVLELPKDFYDAVKGGKIGTSVAMELVNLTPEQQDKARDIFKETGTLKIKDIRGIRKASKSDQLGDVDDEAFDDGKGSYANLSPEGRFEAAAQELITAGMDKDDLVEILDRVLSNMETEAEA